MKTITFSFQHADPGGDVISYSGIDDAGGSPFTGGIKLQPKDGQKVISGVARLLGNILGESPHERWKEKVLSQLPDSTNMAQCETCGTWHIVCGLRMVDGKWVR